jgi:hypothetical protein
MHFITYMLISSATMFIIQIGMSSRIGFVATSHSFPSPYTLPRHYFERSHLSLREAAIRKLIQPNPLNWTNVCHGLATTRTYIYKLPLLHAPL